MNDTPTPADGAEPTVRRLSLSLWLAIYARDSLREFVKAEDYDTLERELASLRREAIELRQAVGLMTTLKGDMVMRPDDPIGMMQEVHAHMVSLRRERDELAEKLRREVQISNGAIALEKKYAATNTELTQEIAALRALVERLTEVRSAVLAWKSVGMALPWVREEVLTVCHGGAHNDTICTSCRYPRANA